MTSKLNKPLLEETILLPCAVPLRYCIYRQFVLSESLVFKIVFIHYVKLLLQESGKGMNDSRVEKMIQPLDNDVIDRWILQCDSKSWALIWSLYPLYCYNSLHFSGKDFH